MLAVVPNQNDTQLSIKIYVKEDLVEYLETENHIKGSSKYSILFWIIGIRNTNWEISRKLDFFLSLQPKYLLRAAVSEFTIEMMLVLMLLKFSILLIL